MISNDYDIDMSAQSKLNKNLLLVSHRIDGLRVMKRNTRGSFEIIKTFQPRENHPVNYFEEVYPGKIIVGSGQRGTFLLIMIRMKFFISKMDHPLKDSIRSSIVDSLKRFEFIS